MRARACWVLLVTVAIAGAARADDLEDEGFGLRLSAAISRYSRYPDVGGLGGASAGSRWASSVNPASSAWMPPPGSMGWVTSVQKWRFSFDNGTEVDLRAASGTYDAGRAGIWQAAVLGLESNRKTMKDGLDLKWEAQSFDLQWSAKPWEDVAIGIDLSYLVSELDFDLGPTNVADSRSSTWGVRAGALWEPSELLFFGLTVDYAFAPSRTKTIDFTGDAGGDVRDSDTAHQALIRPGLYTFLTEELTVFVDYQFGYFTDDTGNLRTHRVFLGMDQTIVEGLYARAGGVVDVEGNLSWTLGLGITLSEGWVVDIAYQHGMFPEIEKEFGSCDVFSAGFTALF